MRKINLIIMLLFIFPILTGFTFFTQVPSPLNGVYSLKSKTLTYFDLVSKDTNLHANLAELTDSKPDDLKIEVADFDKLVDPQYGSFEFGNNHKKIWFLMGKDAKGYWTDFYIDQNLDGLIGTKEKIKGFQTFQSYEQGFKIAEASSLIPTSLRVSYKGITREFEKNLYFFIFISVYSKNNSNETIVKAVTASFFDSQMKARIGKKEKLVKFRIIDFNGNGCYNDYNEDLLYLDLNNDGFYTKNECQTLQEFYSFVDSNKQNRQLHMILLSYPTKVAVTEVSQDFNLSELEAESDDTGTAPGDNTAGPADEKTEESDESSEVN